jgi:hypothetical protein
MEMFGQMGMCELELVNNQLLNHFLLNINS